MAVQVPDNVLIVDRARLGGFFLLFSRFEFALKAGGYARAGRWGAEVDWEKFSREVGARVLPTADELLAKAISYLEESPPKQQKFADNALHWEPRSAPRSYSRARALLFYVQGARNNLMHGAKFLAREAEDPQRDSKLLDASERVIEACLLKIPGLANVFQSDAL